MHTTTGKCFASFWTCAAMLHTLTGEQHTRLWAKQIWGLQSKHRDCEVKTAHKKYVQGKRCDVYWLACKQETFSCSSVDNQPCWSFLLGYELGFVTDTCPDVVRAETHPRGVSSKEDVILLQLGFAHLRSFHTSSCFSCCGCSNVLNFLPSKWNLTLTRSLSDYGRLGTAFVLSPSRMC